MKKAWYLILSAVSRWLGMWVASLSVWVITTWYFLFLPNRLMHSIRLYRAVFPDKGFWSFWSLAWRQYHNFSKLFVERISLLHGNSLSFTERGLEYLEEALQGGRGAILLMSHVGNWEVASHLLKKHGYRLMLYVGEQQWEQIEGLQKEDLERGRIKVVRIAPGEISPLDGLEALNFLRQGGLVSMSGDRLWAGERRVTAKLFGHQVEFPAAPHALSLISDAPLLTFFGIRQKNGEYEFSLSRPNWVKAHSRSERQQAIAGSVAVYAQILEEVIRANPDQWYTFEPYLGSGADKREAK